MAKQTLEEKMAAIAPELLAAAEGMSVAELRSAITERALLYSASKEAERDDDVLSQAKNDVKALVAPYKEDQKAAQLVITYIGKLLESRDGK